MVTTINPSDQTITQYNTQTGGANNLLNNVAPSATSGVPFISQGASSQPVFGTAVVAGGGTGRTTLTNHGVLVGAATTAITQLAAGTAGQVLQSGGASADPAYSTATYPSTGGTASTILRSDGTNFVNTTNFKISSSDIMTNTSQPSFQAYLNTNTGAVTGDGTAYTVICDTQNWDQASNYNTTTGVFTAPVTGKYLFTVTIYLSAISASHTAGFLYMTYNGTNIFTLNSMSYAAVRDNNNQVRLSGTCHMKMNATDTATCVLQVYNGALAVIVNGGTAPFGTTFSGQLMC